MKRNTLMFRFSVAQIASLIFQKAESPAQDKVHSGGKPCFLKIDPAQGTIGAPKAGSD
jgi:hypothetical protein